METRKESINKLVSSSSMSIDENEDKSSHEEMQSQFVEPSGSSKRPRSLRSKVWQFFTNIGVCDDGKTKATCNACGKKYVIGGKTHGTSKLKCHLKKCEKSKGHDIGQMMLDMQGKLKARKIDEAVVRELIVDLMVKHDLPLRFVEFKELWVLLEYLNPDVTPFTRNTGRGVLVKKYMRQKADLKEELASIPNRISLTCNTKGFICLTAHYVD